MRMKKDLVVISNRLPLSFETAGDVLRVRQSSGGLVTALEPLLQKHGGIWIGSAGTDNDPRIREELTRQSKAHHYRYEPIALTLEEHAKFYEGFSNEIIWPLFHDLQGRCNFDPSYWDFYLQVNKRFAECAAKAATKDSLIWINDYQLMQVALQLRKKMPKARLVFFLHIPFPPPDIYEKLPWGRQVLEGLLAHTLIGLQTARDVRNFLSCLRTFLPDVTIVRGAGDIRTVHYAGHETTVGAFPISIDFEDFESASDSDDVRRRSSVLRTMQGHDLTTILGIDRLDYTKGIPERLKAYARFLQQNPKLHRKCSFVQIVVPSRENIPGYRLLKAEIEQLVSQVNGEYAVPGWVPINYVHRSLARTELLALYRTSRVAFITPLKDGMNLVAKEYCACRHDNDGVLILSEFAGAATELKLAGSGALLVNPYDQSAVANALAESLTMGIPEQKRRMTKLRNQIRKSNLGAWLESFLSHGGAAPHADRPAHTHRAANRATDHSTGRHEESPSA
jgi:trehalose 6-phosphate synthase/phosphatase